ncbi:HPr family phosphocarrier protein [Paenarthrobacter nitroguajacolicus]|uniref:HPr family phosphocarrier protein n=1 Tax=Paenarthrobacter nitroguajacolicus TaxID=211146 RepID=UPI00285EA477|nr:HPr family phosphocarrier protein [Paenarthrobacter nitroguajacolicus]MDR6639510.1 phosphocarrier protein [Paenarthrobacter nitroguajacolicus]
MPERTAIIASTSGLHARPATVFVKAAAAYEDLDITIGREEEPAGDSMDASSVLSLMSLGLEHGDRVVLRSTTTGSEQALDHLVRLLQTNHDA